MRHCLILLIRTYQLFLSPLLGNHCRFYPSCSQYAVEAIERHGPWRGGLLALPTSFTVPLSLTPGPAVLQVDFVSGTQRYRRCLSLVAYR